LKPQPKLIILDSYEQFRHSTEEIKIQEKMY
jgi:hypothetical protein